jgi:hypothetical protein
MPSISDAVNVRSMDDLKRLFGLIGTMIGDIQVDILSNLEVSYTYSITTKPIERGEEGSSNWLNDARIENPMRVSMTAVMTNSIENFSASSLIKTAIMSKGKGMADSWKQKREYLMELKDKNEIIDVVTPDNIYKSLMLESLTFTQSNSLDACFFSADFVEVNIKNTDVSSPVTEGALSDIMGM